MCIRDSVIPARPYLVLTERDLRKIERRGENFLKALIA